MDCFTHVASPLGRLTLASDGEALTGLWLDGLKYFAATLHAPADEREVPVFAETRRWLSEYFAGIRPDFTPLLRPEGSPFRRAVWELLLAVPYGERVSYGELAAMYRERYGAQTSPRAIGGAVGHNPVSLIIPCHRVVGSGGALTGYAGGTERKAFLLALESAHRSDAR